MRYTLLGKSGLRVSELALGTMTFGTDWKLPPEVPGRLLDQFADAGGNLLDTANEYGNGTAESLLGELLAGRRDRFVLSTKYTMQTRPGDLNSAGNHRKNLVNSLEASLRRLRTDHLDLLWVHARDTLTPVPEVMRALEDVVRAGKVLYVGVSDWPAWEVAQANTLAELRGWSAFVGLQLHYNLLDRTAERELLPMAHAFDLPVLAWGPLADGRLTGKYLTGGTGRLDSVAWGRARGEGDDVVREVLAVAEAVGRPPAQVALAWLRSRPGTVIPLVGATSEEQLRQNLSATELSLDDEQLAALDRVSAVPAGFPHAFLRFPAMVRLIYGDQWDQVDDRRTTVRRAVADDLYGTAAR
ncbi:aldo/keto reductase [Streptomyces sp. BE20]|uniref:aldo/keto reductase n=1 Tax=unclassified Streptomyces TaxID=2593676 RepID=UPI002E770FFF|nr:MULTISPECIES: aldo/keto reductase [unclassified Streptomyces]MED7950339.1 aldo/keto reductase [Streptomyces sp. BE303]MEE1828580.1 aldo/keto reductase [Streptomyces sp. BE20]